MPPDCFCNNWAKRCVISRDVSIKRSTQLDKHVSVALSNLEPGLPMHLSQQISLNSWIYKKNNKINILNKFHLFLRRKHDETFASHLITLPGH